MKILSYLIAIPTFIIVAVADTLRPGATYDETRAIAAKVAIYQDLIGKPNTDKTIGAFFIPAVGLEKTKLIETFANWNPRVDIGMTNNLVVKDSGVSDAVSKRQAKILSVEIIKVTPKRIEALGRCYATPQAAATYTYILDFNGTNWIILKKELKTIS